MVDLTGHRILPGLINAHDHLSLDLLPHLGQPPYTSLYRFAEEVYQPQASPIRDVLQVAPLDRFEWGGYKNLISGVTTVVNHDPYPRRLLLRWLFGRRFPVRVPWRLAWSHSLRLGEDPVGEFRRSRGRPFVIHAAEGLDEECHGEIDRLHAHGLLRRNTVLVHGIAMQPQQRHKLIDAGASLIWCPVSNLRLYGRTAPVAELSGQVRLGLGTDSTLTGSATLFDEIRAAVDTDLASPQDVLAMVTTTAAEIFGLGRRGTITAGAVADLVALPDAGRDAATTLLAARPIDLALVTVGGRAHLARPALAEALDLGRPNVRLEGQPRWLMGEPADLLQRIAEAAGEAALASHPVWQMVRPIGLDGPIR
ncbi:MAG: amidohydrolase family protein [Acidobacteriota bacterium]